MDLIDKYAIIKLLELYLFRFLFNLRLISNQKYKYVLTSMYFIKIQIKIYGNRAFTKQND